MENKTNTQDIKILKDKLYISLKEAKELLGKYKTIEISEQKFHQNNINYICRLTGCDEVMAEKYYHLFHFDREKAIQKIAKETQIIRLSTSNKNTNKVGFIVWAENESIDKYLSPTEKYLFIPSEDFDLVILAFQSVYPLQNSENIESSFDYTGRNDFDNSNVHQIVKNLASIENEDPDFEIFIRNLIQWLQIQLRFADYIIVEGNL